MEIIEHQERHQAEERARQAERDRAFVAGLREYFDAVETAPARHIVEAGRGLGIRFRDPVAPPPKPLRPRTDGDPVKAVLEAGRELGLIA